MPFRLVRIPVAGRLDRSHPDLDPAFAQVHACCAPFTMTSVERMYALWEAVRYIRRRDVPGDVVECGVWRGGSSMVAARALEQEGEGERRLWLYDTFEGMSADLPGRQPRRHGGVRTLGRDPCSP